MSTVMNINKRLCISLGLNSFIYIIVDLSLIPISTMVFTEGIPNL